MLKLVCMDLELYSIFTIKLLEYNKTLVSMKIKKY